MCSHTYIVRDDKPLTYIYSHLIVACMFVMPPIMHFVKGNFASYELRLEVLDYIIDAIEVVTL